MRLILLFNNKALSLHSSFSETESLLFTGTPEEQTAEYKALSEVKAKCVATVVMSVENASKAANNLIDSINRFNMMLHQATKGQDNATRTDSE